MKRWLILGAVLGLTSVPILAQPVPPPPERSDNRYDRDDDDRDDRRASDGRRGERSSDRDRNRGRRYQDWDDVGPPSHWGDRGRRAWERHVNACFQRYSSYNPRTDRYYVRRGETRRCMLALPAASYRRR